MNGTSSIPPLPTQAPRADRSRIASMQPLVTASGNGDHRHRLLDQCSNLDGQAREAAARGELAASARLILEALDCERRAGGLGPQVLQLIKPR